MSKEITVVGAAIVDVLAGPVDKSVFGIGSVPVERTMLSFGGDALNETVALSKLGKKASIVTKLGRGDAGRRVLDFLHEYSVDTSGIVYDDSVDTSINIVLVDPKGERFFLTNPRGTMRKLSWDDIRPNLGKKDGIVCLASMFVSPALDLEGLQSMFRYVKQNLNCTLAVDMTKAKNGETLEDLKTLLPYIDYIFPNRDEIALVTGCSDPLANAKALVSMGVGCAVVKCGSEGCIICTKDKTVRIPAYPVEKCIDTTGAGDCFAAGFLYALSEGMSDVECGCYACAMGSCAVEQLGATAGIKDRNEVVRRFNSIRSHLSEDLQELR